jgi:hypothetical protein
MSNSFAEFLAQLHKGDDAAAQELFTFARPGTQSGSTKPNCVLAAPAGDYDY